MNFLVLFLLFLSAVLVAVGDAFLKEAAISGNFAKAFQNWWFYGALFFYLAQIVIVVYIFLGKLPLGIVGTGLTFVYAVVMVLIGYYFFDERFSMVQLAGVILGIAGVFLMTYKI